MQETPNVQAGATDITEAGMREYLKEAVTQTEALLKLLHTLQSGTQLPLTMWQDVFAASHRALEHITNAVTQAQEVFDGHMVLMPGFVSEELSCDELECLTWK